MAILSASALKALYEEGDIPSASDYASLIDSMGLAETTVYQQIKGVYYVATSGVADHSNTGQTGGLAWIIDQYGADPITIEFPGDTTYSLVNNNLTIPATTHLRFQQGAVLDIGTGVTLTVQGSIDSGPWQIFDVTGTLTVSAAKVPYFLPQWWGVLGDGTTDDAAALQLCATATAGRPVYFLPATYVLSNVTGVSGQWILPKGATLKHTAAATDQMIEVDASFTLLGPGTVDGNKANQTGRYYTIEWNGASGGDLIVRDVSFTGTISGGIWAYDLDNGALLSITGCHFDDMEEHGGTSGETSLAVYLSGSNAGANVDIRGNHVTNFNTPSVWDRAPAGFEVFSAYGEFASVDISHNYFYGIGQSASSNAIGAIDLYGQTDNCVISGNRFENPYYSSIKTKNSDGIIVTGNAIAGYGTDQHTAGAIVMASLNFYPEPGRTALRFIVSDNIIQDSPGSYAIQIAGDEDNGRAQLVTIDNNVITGQAHAGIWLDGCEDVQITNNIISNGLGSGALDAGIVLNRHAGVAKIAGGQIIDNASYGIMSQGSTNTTANITIEGVTFARNTYQHIYATKFNTITLLSNSFIGPTPNSTYIVNADGTVYAYNNVAPQAAAVGISGNYAYYHECNSWDRVYHSVSKDLGSVNTGRNIAASETVSGIVVTDQLSVAVDGNTSSLIPYARITATNTVEYGLINFTGGTVDAGSVTFYFEIKKRGNA